MIRHNMTVEEKKESRVCERERKKGKRKREMRQGRQGTYTEGTATVFPSPPLLYKHREDTQRATQYTKVVVTHKTRKRRGKGEGEKERGMIDS